MTTTRAAMTTASKAGHFPSTLTGAGRSPSACARRMTNRDGEATDVRLAKNGAAAALTALRPANAAPEALVFRGLNGQSIGRRFAAAAKSAGIEGVTAHSGRVGLASELTAAGASTTETMLAGGWKTARMVAHYSAGASAERGAVAKYL